MIMNIQQVRVWKEVTVTHLTCVIPAVI